jgi:riboflavin transporter FmnP
MSFYTFYIPFYILYLYFRVCCFSAVCICCITTIFAYTCLLNGTVEYIVTTLDIFVFTNHMKMAAKGAETCSVRSAQ